MHYGALQRFMKGVYVEDISWVSMLIYIPLSVSDSVSQLQLAMLASFHQ